MLAQGKEERENNSWKDNKGGRIHVVVVTQPFIFSSMPLHPLTIYPSSLSTPSIFPLKLDYTLHYPNLLVTIGLSCLELYNPENISSFPNPPLTFTFLPLKKKRMKKRKKNLPLRHNLPKNPIPTDPTHSRRPYFLPYSRPIRRRQIDNGIAISTFIFDICYCEWRYDFFGRRVSWFWADGGHFGVGVVLVGGHFWGWVGLEYFGGGWRDELVCSEVDGLVLDGERREDGDGLWRRREGGKSFSV